jgi:energy-coupling factor transport system ATP-binding protein
MVLDDGKVVAIDTPQKIFSRDDLDSYGVEAPAFTKICRGLGKKNPSNGCYPVTLEEAYDLLKNEKGEM